MKAARLFHVEPRPEHLPIPSTRRLVTEDDAAAYLKRVEEARDRLRTHASACKGTSHEFVVCDKL